MKAAFIIATAPLVNDRRAIWIVYLCIAVLYFGNFGQQVSANWVEPTLWIAPIMAVGSFVAGSTFLGGGSIAFPALTKLLSVDPITAKTFSLSIQSVGMTSASAYIFFRVRRLPYGFMAVYLLGVVPGLLLSLGVLENRIPPVDIRISFTLFLVCFLTIYLMTRNSHNSSQDTHLERNARDVGLTFACGFLGGAVSGLLGSGADVIGFTLLAFYFRIEIVRAIQISVVLMAATSIIGMVMQAWTFNDISTEVKSLWYIAAPVVLFGAPIGAAVCRRLPRRFLLWLICLIVVAEVISTLLLVPIGVERLLYYAMAAASFIGMMLLFRKMAEFKHA